MKDNGTRIMSPGFPFVDRDMDLDVVEMEKIIQTSKLAIASFSSYFTLVLPFPLKFFLINSPLRPSFSPYNK